METINIVCACDKNFVPFSASMLASVFENNLTSHLQVFFLHNNISKSDQKKLVNFSQRYHHILIPVHIHNKTLKGLKRVSQYTKAIYFRLLIPDLLPAEIEKVIYLDSDLIVRTELLPLWNIPIDDFPLAAVAEPDYVDRDRLEQLGWLNCSQYFNSGVMLINLNWWREKGTHLKALTLIKERPNQLFFPDQDALNVITGDHWLRLPVEWNVMSSLFRENSAYDRFEGDIKEPYIVHFTGHQKPWHPQSNHKYKTEYESYQIKTPWNNGKSLSYRALPFFTLLLNIARKLKQRSRYKLITRFKKWLYKVGRAIYHIPIKKLESVPVKQLIEEFFPERTVTEGPFKGMRYPSLVSVGSALGPKLLGSYEAELHPIIEHICKKGYSTIIDIGCAEGYYAVGLAIRSPDAQVFAFDIDELARRLCQEMAVLNQVDHRLVIGENFSLDKLPAIPSKDYQGLIVSDCEGAEQEIFTMDSNNWDILIQHYDLLIEIHEHLKPGVRNQLVNMFSDSHSMKSWYSVEDVKRPIVFPSKILQKKSLSYKIALMAENRQDRMEWIYFERK